MCGIHRDRWIPRTNGQLRGNGQLSPRFLFTQGLECLWPGIMWETIEGKDIQSRAAITRSNTTWSYSTHSLYSQMAPGPPQWAMGHVYYEDFPEHLSCYIYIGTVLYEMIWNVMTQSHQQNYCSDGLTQRTNSVNSWLYVCEHQLINPSR